MVKAVSAGTSPRPRQRARVVAFCAYPAWRLISTRRRIFAHFAMIRAKTVKPGATCWVFDESPNYPDFPRPGNPSRSESRGVFAARFAGIRLGTTSAGHSGGHAESHFESRRSNRSVEQH